MSTLHNYPGLLGCLLLLTATPLLYLRRPRFSRKVVTITLFTMLAIAIIPLNNLAIIVYIRGVVADLSITSMLLLAIFIAEAYSGKIYISTVERQRLHQILLLAGLILYPLALGLSPWDSYAMGYGNIWFTLPLAGLSIHLLIRQNWYILFFLLAGIAAYTGGLLASNNLWDYLIDFWLFLFVLIKTIIKPVYSAFTTTTTPE